MNLPFGITHEELRELFTPFGDIEEVEIPLRRGGTGYGFAFVRFKTVEATVSAFAKLDKTYFQGRKLHILPAQKKPRPVEVIREVNEEVKESDNKNEEKKDTEVKREEEKAEKKPEEKEKPKKSKFKEEREKELKSNFDDEINWNYLFMNQDAVATSMA